MSYHENNFDPKGPLENCYPDKYLSWPQLLSEQQRLTMKPFLHKPCTSQSPCTTALEAHVKAGSPQETSSESSSEIQGEKKDGREQKLLIKRMA